ncbi:MAG: hypothetical protein HKP61_15920, partial [Dactylosporangium sp.]|nr:type IV secretion system protein [Dactylosporangium sp.]NNJ62393.1 hypothetical protein [Dactylosporangium sp.]
MVDPFGILSALFGWLGDKASDVAVDAFNKAMLDIWNFASDLLTGVFGIIDKYTTPNVDPTNGPLAGLLPMTGWLGVSILLLMSFVQVGKAVAQGGRGFVRILVGLAQYVGVTVAGLAVLTTMVAASDSLALAILNTGLDVETWEGVSGRSSAAENVVNGVSGTGLGLVALLCVIPAAIGLLIEALVRNAAIVILAGTIPILAAGLIADATRRWFWTGLRWMVSLLLMTPAMALTMTIGMRFAEGAAGADGQQQGAVQSAVGMVVSGLVLIIALCCPLALFKLFAFVEPNSLSGAAVRGYFAGGGGGGGSGGGGTASSSEKGAESDSDNRFTQMLSSLGTTAANTAATASGVLDAVGAGHPGGPPGNSSGGGNADPPDSDDAGTSAGDAGT